MTEIQLYIVWGTGLLVVLIFVTALVYAWRRNQRYHKLESLHETLAFRLNSRLSYRDERNFLVYGDHRNYKFRMTPISEESGEHKVPLEGLRISIPMTNPNRKYLRVAKLGQAFGQAASVDKFFVVQHEAKEWLEILSNDMFFSSLLLTEDLKISLGAHFQKYNGVLFIEDNEMVYVAPTPIREEEQIESIEAALRLMCDMKDELNVK